MRRLLMSLSILLAVLIAPGLSPLAAQGDDTVEEKWYFSVPWSRDSGPLTAFTVEGEANTLIEAGVDRRPEGQWRLGPQLALAVLVVDGEPGLYRLTPDAATVLRPTFEIGESDEALLPLILTAYNAPYAVFATRANPPAVPFLLANLETGTLDLLTGDVSLGNAFPRFSADGAYLRYLSWDPATDEDWDEAPWTLWERELATGTEQAVHTLTNVRMNVAADRHGERWLQVQFDGDAQVQTYTWFYADGSSELLDEFSLEDGPPSLAYKLYDDDLMVVDPACDTDCAVTFRPLAGGDPVTFIVPEWQAAFSPLSWLDPTHFLGARPVMLLAMDSERLWLLGDDGSAERIGFWSPQHVFTPRQHVVSPDGRWVLVLEDLDEPAHYIVWDTQTRSPLVEGEMDVAANIWYGDHGFLVTNARWERFAMCYYAEGTVTWLPEVERGSYLDVLPDGAVLYHQMAEVESRAAGLYRYDPGTDTFTFLFENQEPIALLQWRW